MGFFKKNYIIGLDMGAASVKLAKFLKKEDDSLLLESLKTEEIQEGQTREAAFKKLFSDIDIRNSEIIAVINYSGTMVKRALVPRMPGAELKEAIRLEARNYFPFDISDSLLDFEELGEVSEKGVKKIEILAGVSPNKAIRECLDSLTRAGLKASSLIPQAAALCNLLALRSFPPGASIAALNIGKALSELVIIRDRRIAFNRKVPVCAEDFTRAMLSALSSQAGKIQLSYEEAEAIKIRYGIPQENSPELIENKITSGQLLSLLRSPAEKLSSEIERSFDFYREESRVSRVEKLLLLGGGGQLKGLDSFLSKELGIGVEVYKSLEGVNVKEGTLPAGFEAGRVAMAVGAALDKKEGINFLPWEIKRDTQRLIEKAALKALVSAAVTLLALIFIGMRIQLVNLDKKISGASSELASLRLRFGKAEDWPLMNRLIGAEPRWGDILKEISNTIPLQAYLKEISLQAGQITVKGNIISLKNSEEILSGFIRKLEGGIFKNVRFVSLQEAATGREFELQAEAE